jgi:hypothetical protein
MDSGHPLDPACPSAGDSRQSGSGKFSGPFLYPEALRRAPTVGNDQGPNGQWLACQKSEGKDTRKEGQGHLVGQEMDMLMLWTLRASQFTLQTMCSLNAS